MRLKLLMGTALAALSANAASAVEPVRPVIVPAPVPTLLPAYNWGGFYVGGAAGLGTQRTTWDDVDGWFDDDPLRFKLKNSGFTLGAYAGYNFLVSPQFLLGVETDITRNFGDDGLNLDDELILSSDANWLGSTRLRLGWTLDRTLLYATGGIAYGNPSATWRDDFGAAWKADGWRVGYAIGAGVEYAATTNWLLRLEGIYYNLGHENAKDITPSTEIASEYTPGYRQRVKFDGFNIRAGVAYKF